MNTAVYPRKELTFESTRKKVDSEGTTAVSYIVSMNTSSVLTSVVVLREETIPPYAVAFTGTNITKCKYCMYCCCINVLQEGSTAGVRSTLATYPPEKKNLHSTCLSYSNLVTPCLL